MLVEYKCMLWVSCELCAVSTGKSSVGYRERGFGYQWLNHSSGSSAMQYFLSLCQNLWTFAEFLVLSTP